MAFKIGDRLRQDVTSRGKSQGHTNVRTLFSQITADSNSLDSDSIFAVHNNSSNWKKNPSPGYDVSKHPYKGGGTRLRNAWKNWDMYNPQNFTISDNIGGYISQDKNDGTQGDTTTKIEDGRGAQWAIPLFNHPFWYTSPVRNYYGNAGDGEREYSIRYNSNVNKIIHVNDFDIADSVSEDRLIKGITDFRPSSLIEPDQWAFRVTPMGSGNRVNRSNYIFDADEDRNIQYFQLLTTPNWDFWEDLESTFSIYSDMWDVDLTTTYNGGRSPLFDTRRKIEKDDFKQSTPKNLSKNDLGFKKEYGKVVGYVLEPGRHIRVDSDEYPDWQHTDAYGKGKWAGRTVPRFTALDSDWGYGIDRSVSRKNNGRYLVNGVVQERDRWSYSTGGVFQADQFRFEEERDPYAAMTMGSPCMLTYFGKLPTASDITTYGTPDNDYFFRIFPRVNALGFNDKNLDTLYQYENNTRFDLSNYVGAAYLEQMYDEDFIGEWPSGISAGAGSQYYGLGRSNGWVLQDVIDSSAVNWSSGKGYAPLQQTVNNASGYSHKYPYVVADYCPSRSNYLRKDENLCISVNQVREQEYVQDFGRYYLALGELKTRPTVFTLNDWEDSVSQSNTKDVLVINNFDSDTIVCNMVKDWECWRR